MNTGKNIKRILCFGDSLTFGKIPGPTKRYSNFERWTGILQELLGDTYEIIEEGLRGRTTDMDDDKSAGRNGLPYFQSCILSHLPVDLVIILLGTNDLKEKFHRTPEEIAGVFKKYKESIIAASLYLEESEPKILLISPPFINEARSLPEWGFTGGEEKSNQLAHEYMKTASELNAYFLDLAPQIKSSEIDGVHLDLENNKKVAYLIKDKIIEINV